MNKQRTKNSFDKQTLARISKGALYASSGSFAITILQYVETVDISNPSLAAIVAWAVPFTVNAVKEWVKSRK